MRTIPSLTLAFLPYLALSAAEIAPSRAGQGYNPGLAGGQGYNPGQGGGHDREQGSVSFTASRATAYSRTGPGQLVLERSVTNLGGGHDREQGPVSFTAT